MRCGKGVVCGWDEWLRVGAPARVAGTQAAKRHDVFTLCGGLCAARPVRPSPSQVVMLRCDRADLADAGGCAEVTHDRRSAAGACTHRNPPRGESHMQGRRRALAAIAPSFIEKTCSSRGLRTPEPGPCVAS